MSMISVLVVVITRDKRFPGLFVIGPFTQHGKFFFVFGIVFNIIFLVVVLFSVQTNTDLSPNHPVISVGLGAPSIGRDIIEIVCARRIPAPSDPSPRGLVPTMKMPLAIGNKLIRVLSQLGQRFSPVISALPREFVSSLKRPQDVV